MNTRDDDEMRALGVDEVYCISVNDAFVMHNWAKSPGLKNVKLIPDGSAHFTRRMGMLVKGAAPSPATQPF